MTDEIALARATQQAAQARRLLDDDMLKQAWADRETDLIAAWIATNPGDVEARERCFSAIHANRKHRDYIASHVINGKLAAAELSRNAEMTERKPRWQDIR